jgi:hypothetical protein
VSGRWLTVALPALGLALAAAGAWPALRPPGGDAGAEAASRAALELGNRLVRDGDLDGALAAYAAGWRAGHGGDSDGLLAYNLGTTAHRAGRLPEALLWYRRSAALRPRDPWLADNLALVRAELAAPRQAPPGALARLAASRGRLAAAATAAAWLALALLALRPRLEGRRGVATPVARWGWAPVAAAALALWCAGPLAAVGAPRPAVLLADCAGASGMVPAGAEVWVRRDGGRGWALAGPEGPACPASAVAPIGPISASFESL